MVLADGNRDANRYRLSPGFAHQLMGQGMGMGTLIPYPAGGGNRQDVVGAEFHNARLRPESRVTGVA